MKIYSRTATFNDDYNWQPSMDEKRDWLNKLDARIGTGRRLAILWSKGGVLSLLVSAKANRHDARQRIITDLLFLVAESNDDKATLAEMFRHCLLTGYSWYEDKTDKLNSTIDYVCMQMQENGNTRELLEHHIKMEWPKGKTDNPLNPLKGCHAYPQNHENRKVIAGGIHSIYQSKGEWLCAVIDSLRPERLCEIISIYPGIHQFIAVFSDKVESEVPISCPEPPIKKHDQNSLNLTQPRLFAFLEKWICLPMSLVALLMIPIEAMLVCYGYKLPIIIAGYIHPILMSAAIGYLTNWLAIEMLFKPYRKTLKHPLAWLTLGFWQQGLVPKNKHGISIKLGEMVAKELLKPEDMAKDLCQMITDMMDNPAIVAELQASLQQLATAHNKEIVAYLSPKIEEAVLTEIDRLLTSDTLYAFWESQIEPMLSKEDVRERLAEVFIESVSRQLPEIAEKVRPALVQLITDYCREKGGAMFGSLMSKMAEGLADRILSAQTIENGIRGWLNNPNTLPLLRGEIISFIQAIRAYLKSPEANGYVTDFTSQMKDKFKDYLTAWLQENLLQSTNNILKSEQLWQSLSSSLVEARPQIENFITTHGMPMILEKLDVQGRIQETVDKQDVKKFHRMINEIAAQHLGAIQVLGFILGAVAGGLMLLVQ